MADMDTVGITVCVALIELDCDTAGVTDGDADTLDMLEAALVAEAVGVTEVVGVADVVGETVAEAVLEE